MSSDEVAPLGNNANSLNNFKELKDVFFKALIESIRLALRDDIPEGYIKPLVSSSYNWDIFLVLSKEAAREIA